MPGFVAAACLPQDVSRSIVEGFRDVWPHAQSVQARRSTIAAHSCDPNAALMTGADGSITAVDGEYALYRELYRARQDRRISLLRSRGEGTTLDSLSVGSVVRLTSDGDELVVATDSTGTFPVYYAESGAGLMVSTHLRPIARALRAVPDPIATLAFLREGHVVGPSTQFKGIRRLLPGQVLTFRFGRGMRLAETSDAWVPRQQSGAAMTAEVLWDGLTSAVRRALPPTCSTLMMSGGWDSRTLLAAALSAEIAPTCYSHGDTASRELAIVRDICERSGLGYRLEPIDDRALDPDLLARGFACAENVVFPHWHRAGRLISEGDRTVISAGVLGEVLGGHYGPAMVRGHVGKVLSVGATLLGSKTAGLGSSGPSARELLLRRSPFGPHWYLARDFEATLVDAADAIDAETETQLSRFERRGVGDQAALVEAFICEHRGAQYISAQLRSCRAHADVAIPFGGGELFSISSALPIQLKVHNRLNQLILAQHSPDLLRQPFAATLLPASTPILLQEASRLLRKGTSALRDRLAELSGGRIARSRTGWVNFEFLRTSHALRPLVDSLTLPIWDRAAIEKAVRRLRDPGGMLETHPFFDQFAKILTVEHMFRDA